MKLLIAEERWKIFVYNSTCYAIEPHYFRHISTLDCVLKKWKHIFYSSVDSSDHPSEHCNLNKKILVKPIQTESKFIQIIEINN